MSDAEGDVEGGASGASSALVTRLARIVGAVRGRAPDAAELLAIDEAVTNHFVPPDAAPEWMLELLDRLLEARSTEGRLPLPEGYPHGENGLANVLADVERSVAPLGIQDEGEWVAWPLPSLGVRLVVLRESGTRYAVELLSPP